MKPTLCICGHTNEQHYHNFITVGCRICKCTTYKEDKKEPEPCPVCGKTDLSHPAHTFRCHEIEELRKEASLLQHDLYIAVRAMKLAKERYADTQYVYYMLKNTLEQLEEE